MSIDINSDSANQADPTVTQVELTVPFPDSFVYSNVSALSASFMDIRIGFGEAMPDGTVQPRIGVVLPPEHAAQLVLNLFQNLTFFERTFGPIRNKQCQDSREKARANAEVVLQKRAQPATEPPPSREK